jgi:hypothetical protein
LGPRSATEIARRIGTLSKPLPVQEIFTLSQPTSLFGIIAHYGESLVYLINKEILHNLKLLNVLFTYSMDPLVRESLDVLGRKPNWGDSLYTLRIHALNFGVDIEVRTILLLMNFVEVSTSLTYYAGLIDIPFVWKLKEDPSPWWEARCGSPLISIQETGIPTLMQPASPHLKED